MNLATDVALCCPCAQMNLAAACVRNACMLLQCMYNTHLGGALMGVPFGWVCRCVRCTFSHAYNEAAVVLRLCWHRTQIHLHYVWLLLITLLWRRQLQSILVCSDS